MIEPEQFNPVAGGPFIDIAAQLNKLRRFAISIRPVAGKNTQIQETSHGSMIDASANGAVGETAAELGIAFYIVNEVAQSDVLICDKLTSSGARSGGATVAKPFHLRGSVVAANTGNFTWASGTPQQRTRKLSNDGGIGNIVERITPGYAVDSIIAAVDLGHVFKSGSTAGTVTGLLYGGAAVTVLDLNTDARNWFPNYANIDVCVNNVTRRMSVIGGSIQ